MDGFVKIALAITTVALVAEVVVNGTNSAKIITAASQGYATSIGAAEKG
jgi:hypothetical protein